MIDQETIARWSRALTEMRDKCYRTSNGSGGAISADAWMRICLQDWWCYIGDTILDEMAKDVGVEHP